MQVALPDRFPPVKTETFITWVPVTSSQKNIYTSMVASEKKLFILNVFAYLKPFSIQ